MASADNSVLLGPTLPGAAKERFRWDGIRRQSVPNRPFTQFAQISRSRMFPQAGSANNHKKKTTRKRKEENANSQTDAYHCVVSRLGSYHGDSGPVPFSRSATRPCGQDADLH